MFDPLQHRLQCWIPDRRRADGRLRADRGLPQFQLQCFDSRKCVFKFVAGLLGFLFGVAGLQHCDNGSGDEPDQEKNEEDDTGFHGTADSLSGLPQGGDLNLQNESV